MVTMIILLITMVVIIWAMYITVAPNITIMVPAATGGMMVIITEKEFLITMITGGLISIIITEEKYI